MNIFIPEWVLWVFGVPVGIAAVFLAVLGLMVILEIGKW